MYPEVLREHIQKCKKETSKPLVNVPMLYPNIEEIMKIIVEEGENRFTSAGIQKRGLLI
jgi:enoyl-[acyl-carrier protein] reductase II